MVPRKELYTNLMRAWGTGEGPRPRHGGQGKALIQGMGDRGRPSSNRSHLPSFPFPPLLQHLHWLSHEHSLLPAQLASPEMSCLMPPGAGQCRAAFPDSGALQPSGPLQAGGAAASYHGAAQSREGAGGREEGQARGRGVGGQGTGVQQRRQGAVKKSMNVCYE